MATLHASSAIVSDYLTIEKMKGMKTNIYLMIAILCTLISCAEEGPYRMGKLETSIELQYATPDMAGIKVTLPRNNDNLLNGEFCHAYLTLKPLSDAGNDWREDYISGDMISNDDRQFVFRFKYLNPDTQYYLVLDSRVDFNGANDSDYEYYPDFSFTTAKEGDYSGLGEVTCELVSHQLNRTIVKFNLPSAICFPEGQYGHYAGDLNAVRAFASTSPDMSNSIASMPRSNYDGPMDEFAFEGLQVGQKYYFQLRGKFYWSLNNNGYEFDLDNITLNVHNPMELSEITENQVPQLNCKLYFAGENFSIISFSLPSNSGLSWGWVNYKGTWKYRYSSELHECKISNDGHKTDAYVYIPEKIKNGSDITITFEGKVNDNYDRSQVYNFECDFAYSIENAIQPNPTCQIVFPGKDYSLVKVSYPANISYSSYCKPIYLVYDGTSESESYEWESISVGEYGIVKTFGNQSAENILKVKLAYFNMDGIEVGNGIINIDGSIKVTENKQELFNISSRQGNDELKIIIRCPSRFHFDVWGDLLLKCIQKSDITSSILFSVTETIRTNSSQEVEFTLKKEEYEKLQSGETYNLVVSGFNLMYESNYTNYSTQEFDLNWTYLP